MTLSVLDAVSAINDATALITALGPLIKDAMDRGETEISDEDVAFARASLVLNIDSLDALIEKAKQPV